MASSTSGAGIRRTGTLALAALLLSAALIDAQTPLTLEQAASRRTGDYAPAWSGLLVTVHGQVSTPAYRFLDYTLLPIQQGTGGIVLHVPDGDTRLDAYQAGDWIEVTGTVSAVSGMPVIDPARIAVTGRDQAPRPERVPLTALLGFQQLGRLVETEGQITEIGETRTLRSSRRRAWQDSASETKYVPPASRCNIARYLPTTAGSKCCCTSPATLSSSSAAGSFPQA